ncbi:DUF202 domain-containing protein [Egicoccus halophilus]|uniref:DUF202 domain-containing protein n=1 Tax=Egicoccus halophilus TaxID=1670830 RepID=A0A8J3ETG9_9ACTN|nr:DUF202 domain-containing protein [Egicoccus halophilus]GGI05597.1 hypothetical protein GCM10011354_14880 [Egicoccus halophilus]
MSDGPPGLQAERTGLAWSRTGLATGAGALTLARLASLRGAPVLAAIGLLVAVLALAVLVEGGVRGKRRTDWLLDQGGARALPRAAIGLVAAVVGLAGSGLLLVVGTG